MQKVNCGAKRFVPGKIICVGKNYFEHRKEMGDALSSNEPVIFIKPNSAIVQNKKKIFVPKELGLLHHEVELCFMLGKKNKIIGYAAGLDLTLRDRQSAAKRAGEPWTLAKGFNNAAPLGKFVPAGKVKNPLFLKIELFVNGVLRQSGNAMDMIYKPAGLISFVSRFMTLEEGDIFMTGTPAGVGPLCNGDLVDAKITGIPGLSIIIQRC